MLQLSGIHALQADDQSEEEMTESKGERGTDEDWSRRNKKRWNAIIKQKKKPYYIEALIQESVGSIDERERAMTPDPDNRDTPKRGWEASMKRWRRALRGNVAEDAAVLKR